MPARKMRVDLFDNEGNRYTISFEGQITREKALRLLDLLELLGGMPSGVNSEANTADITKDWSKYDKVRIVIQKHFPMVWFTSRDVQSIFEQEFKEPISISTVATYLTRMANKGLLVKTGSSNRLKYKVVLSPPQMAFKQQT